MIAPRPAYVNCCSPVSWIDFRRVVLRQRAGEGGRKLVDFLMRKRRQQFHLTRLSVGERHTDKRRGPHGEGDAFALGAPPGASKWTMGANERASTGQTSIQPPQPIQGASANPNEICTG